MQLTIITKSITYNGRTIKTGRTALKSIRAERELRPSSSAPSQLQPATERKMEGRKPHILWPKYSQKHEQENIDADLVLLLENPEGPVED